MQNQNHSGYTNFDGSPDLAPDPESNERPSSDFANLQLPDIEPERWMYLISGIILALGGLVRRGPLGLLMSGLGGGLLYQGITGINPVRLLARVNANSRANHLSAVDMPDFEQVRDL